MSCFVMDSTINLNVLDSAIEKKAVPHYLVMNTRTLYLMWQKDIPSEEWSQKGGSYGKYRGIPIAICEKLIDGEIDVV